MRQAAVLFVALSLFACAHTGDLIQTPADAISRARAICPLVSKNGKITAERDGDLWWVTDGSVSVYIQAKDGLPPPPDPNEPCIIAG